MFMYIARELARIENWVMAYESWYPVQKWYPLKQFDIKVAIRTTYIRFNSLEI